MNDHPLACVLLIGNELLSGRTQDLNLVHIAKSLLSLGIRVQESRTIADQEDVIIQNVQTCRQKYDYVFTTGGIGPTHDDITAAAMAKAFGVPLYRDPEASRLLKERLGDRLTEAHLKMADIPQGSRLINNPVTAAPGFALENVYVMAGVPAIMQGMLESLLPTLKRGKPFHTQSLTCSLSEGLLAPGLEVIQNEMPTVEIGSYPQWSPSERSLTLVVRGTELSLVEKASQRIEDLILSFKKIS